MPLLSPVLLFTLFSGLPPTATAGLRGWEPGGAVRLGEDAEPTISAELLPSFTLRPHRGGQGGTSGVSLEEGLPVCFS